MAEQLPHRRPQDVHELTTSRSRLDNRIRRRPGFTGAMRKLLFMLGAMLVRRFLPDVGRRLGIPAPVTNVVVALI
jgi:hypothetical protein